MMARIFRLRRLLAVALAVLLGAATEIESFTAPTIASRSTIRNTGRATPTATPTTTAATLLVLFGEKPEYSREMLLREEAESPFRKVRFFFYLSLGAGAMTSLAVSLARIAAGLAGVNADLLQESLINTGVDAGGLVVLAFLYQRDLQAQNSRLKRASKGAELAQLTIRGSKSIITGEDGSDETEIFTTTLASMRRGRGIEKRVVIVAGGKEKIAEVMKDAIELQESLSMNDLVVVPVVMPKGVAPDIESGMNVPSCVAFPVGSGSWKNVVDDEAEEAISQGVDIEKEGFCVILKKNGRVGQRTKGIFLRRMVGEVEERAEFGLDVKNI
jgi:hypothetical protein